MTGGWRRSDRWTFQVLKQRPCTVRDLIAELDYSENSIYVSISRLQAAGRIQVIGTRNRGRGAGSGRGVNVYALVQRPKGA